MGLRDYSDWIFNALPGKAAATDFDCVIEHKGKFLMFEFKPNTWVPKGQRITFDALVASGWTVYLVVDKKASEDKYQVGHWVEKKGVTKWYPMNKAGLEELVNHWWNHGE